MTELTALCGELDARRRLAVDLAAFFELHPGIDAQFGDFQRSRRSTT